MNAKTFLKKVLVLISLASFHVQAAKKNAAEANYSSFICQNPDKFLEQAKKSLKKPAEAEQDFSAQQDKGDEFRLEGFASLRPLGQLVRSDFHDWKNGRQIGTLTISGGGDDLSIEDLKRQDFTMICEASTPGFSVKSLILENVCIPHDQLAMLPNLERLEELTICRGVAVGDSPGVVWTTEQWKEWLMEVCRGAYDPFCMCPMQRQGFCHLKHFDLIDVDGREKKSLIIPGRPGFSPTDDCCIS